MTAPTVGIHIRRSGSRNCGAAASNICLASVNKKLGLKSAVTVLVFQPRADKTSHAPAKAPASAAASSAAASGNASTSTAPESEKDAAAAD